MGSSSTTVSTLNLKTSASYSFTGSISSNSLIASPTLVLPGTINSANALGITPLYNKKLGIFTLSGLPKVNAKFETGLGTQRGDGYGEYDREFSVDNPYEFKVDQSSYSIVYNPDVINTSSSGAHVSNLKTELVYRKDPNAVLISYPINTDFASTYRIPESEFQNLDWDRNTQSFPTVPFPGYPWDMTTNIFTQYFLRVSLDVIPNNGGKAVKIVKTFAMKGEYINIGEVYY